MQIRIIKTGQLLHVPNDQSYEVMRQLGFIEILPKPIPKKIEPKLTWSVTRTLASGELHILVCCSGCASRTPIFNPSERARVKCCGVDEFVSAPVFAEYREVKEKNDPASLATAALEARR